MTYDIEAIRRALSAAPLKGMPWPRLGTMLSTENIEAIAEHVVKNTCLAPVAEGKAVIVPVEPTESMIAAGVGERHLQGTPEAWSMATVNIYRAMIGARG